MTGTAEPVSAGFGRRSMALFLDWVLLVLVATPVSLVMQRFFGAGQSGSPAVEYQPWINYSIEGALVVLVIYCWVRFQGTPGKLLMGCRIVDARSGKAPGIFQAIARLFGYLLSAAPLGLGFLWILRDRKRQGFHDKLARTRVLIDDDSSQSLQQLIDELR